MSTRRPSNGRTDAGTSANPPSLAAEKNLGPKSAAVLARAGITALDQLRQLGSVRAFALARRADPTVTLNLLWSLEGVLVGQAWQSVSREHRASLPLALHDHERHCDG